MLELTYLAAIDRLDRLDDRQLAVLRLVAQGQSDAQTSERVGLGPRRTGQLVTGVFVTLGLRPTPYVSRRTMARLVLRHDPAPATATGHDLDGHAQRAG